MEVDILKIWDYLAEILAPALSQPPLHFHTLAHVYPPLVKVGKAANLAAKVLRQVKLQQSEAAALSMWSQSQLATSVHIRAPPAITACMFTACGQAVIKTHYLYYQRLCTLGKSTALRPLKVGVIAIMTVEAAGLRGCGR